MQMCYSLDHVYSRLQASSWDELLIMAGSAQIAAGFLIWPENNEAEANAEARQCEA